MDTVYQPCECVAAISNKEQNSAEVKSIAVPRFLVFFILLATNNNRQNTAVKVNNMAPRHIGFLNIDDVCDGYSVALQIPKYTNNF